MILDKIRTRMLTVSDKCCMFLMRRRLALSAFAFGLIEKYSSKICLASDTKGPADFLKDGKGNGAFSDLQSKVEDTGASLYSLVRTFAVICLVIGVISIGLGFALGSGHKKEESKSKIVFWIIGAVMIFGCFALLAYAEKVGNSI